MVESGLMYYKMSCIHRTIQKSWLLCQTYSYSVSSVSVTLQEDGSILIVLQKNEAHGCRSEHLDKRYSGWTYSLEFRLGVNSSRTTTYLLCDCRQVTWLLHTCKKWHYFLHKMLWHLRKALSKAPWAQDGHMFVPFPSLKKCKTTLTTSVTKVPFFPPLNTQRLSPSPLHIKPPNHALKLP